MKGLLLKDFYIAKSNMLLMTIGLMVIGFGLSFLMDSSAVLILAPAMFTTAVFISITADATSKWNKLAVTMPVTRKQIVFSKYIFYIALSIFGVLIGVIPSLAMSAIKQDLSPSLMVLYGVLGIGTAFLAGGLSIPCAYIFDPEKSQIVFMISFVSATGIMVGIFLLVNLFFPVKENLILAGFCALLFSIVLFYISFVFAAKTYGRKDI